MGMEASEMLPFKGTLVSFTGERVPVLGHMPIVTLFESGNNAKLVKVRYLIMNVASYNIIIIKSTFNVFESALSTWYLTIKYLLCGGGIGVIKGDQGLVIKCYKDNLKMKKDIGEDPPKEAN